VAERESMTHLTQSVEVAGIVLIPVTLTQQVVNSKTVEPRCPPSVPRRAAKKPRMSHPKVLHSLPGPLCKVFPPPTAPRLQSPPDACFPLSLLFVTGLEIPASAPLVGLHTQQPSKVFLPPPPSTPQYITPTKVRTSPLAAFCKQTSPAQPTNNAQSTQAVWVGGGGPVEVKPFMTPKFRELDQVGHAEAARRLHPVLERQAQLRLLRGVPKRTS